MQVLTDPLEQDPAEVYPSLVESVAVLSTLAGPSSDPAESVDMLSLQCCPVRINTGVVLRWDSRDWISTGSVPATMGQCYTVSAAEL